MANVQPATKTTVLPGVGNIFPPGAASLVTAGHDAVGARRPATYHSAMNKAKLSLLLLADAARILSAGGTTGLPTTRSAANG
eukprot:2003672-Pleurochrysis_carterae.AAC.1